MGSMFEFVNALPKEGFISSFDIKQDNYLIKKLENIESSYENGCFSDALTLSRTLNEIIVHYLYKSVMGSDWGDFSVFLLIGTKDEISNYVVSQRKKGQPVSQDRLNDSETFRKAINSPTLLYRMNFLRIKGNEEVHAELKNSNDTKEEAKFALYCLEYIIYRVCCLTDREYSRDGTNSTISGDAWIEKTDENDNDVDELVLKVYNCNIPEAVFGKDGRGSRASKEKKSVQYTWKKVDDSFFVVETIITYAPVLKLRERDYGTSFICELRKKDMVGFLSSGTPFYVAKTSSVVSGNTTDCVEDFIGHIHFGPERICLKSGQVTDRRMFNSIVDDPKYGDERQFVRVKKLSDDEEYSEKVVVKYHDIIEVFVLYHNNCDDRYNDSGVGIITGAILRIEYPKMVIGKSTGIIRGELETNNSVPKIIWSGCQIYSEESIELAYIPNSAKIHSDGSADGQILDSKSLFGNGAVVAYYNSDWGLIPGGEKYTGYITIQFEVLPKREKKTVELTSGTYVGDVAKGGIRDGIGHMTYKDGNEYDGNWKNDCWDGMGVFSENGMECKGLFVNGHREGGYTLTDDLNRKWLVIYRNDVEYSRAYVTDEGTVIRGEWLDEGWNGKVIEFSSDGHVVEGIKRKGNWEKLVYESYINLKKAEELEKDKGEEFKHYLCKEMKIVNGKSSFSTLEVVDGDEVEVRLYYHNRTDSFANHVTFRDLFPDGYEYVPNSMYACALARDIVHFADDVSQLLFNGDGLSVGHRDPDERVVLVYRMVARGMEPHTIDMKSSIATMTGGCTYYTRMILL